MVLWDPRARQESWSLQLYQSKKLHPLFYLNALVIKLIITMGMVFIIMIMIHMFYINYMTYKNHESLCYLFGPALLLFTLGFTIQPKFWKLMTGLWKRKRVSFEYLNHERERGWDRYEDILRSKLFG